VVVQRREVCGGRRSPPTAIIRVPTMLKQTLPIVALIVACILTVGLAALPAQSPSKPATERNWKASGKTGAVAAGGQEAVDAGLEILKADGRAADAAAAATLVMTVTDSAIVYFGGEIPILHYDAGRKVVEVLCGQGAAPRLATREYFAKKGGIPGKGIEP